MVVSYINDPEHWRSRAEEAGTLAEQMSDETSKQMMMLTGLRPTTNVLPREPPYAQGARPHSQRARHRLANAPCRSD